MRILPWAVTLFVVAAPVAGQSLRTVTNTKLGFKVKVPRFLKEVPTKPDEEQIIAKFKGTKKLKVPRGRIYKDRKGERLKEYPQGFEVWVVRIKNPEVREGKTAPKTPGRKPPIRTASGGNLSDQARRHKNAGRTMQEFMRRRLRGIVLTENLEAKPLLNKKRVPYSILSTKTNGPVSPRVLSYTFVHEHADYGHELFGLVFICSRMDAFKKLVPTCVKSLQRLDPVTAYKKTDPYAGSKLRDIKKRREIRSRLVKGWYAEDTKNFILVTDMTSNSSNRQLLKDMLIDLEIMRKEFEKRFPPIKPVKVVCTVRVCNSYDGYLRYSSKPGTGGYWHPIAEELVLFNPVGKIKKAAWMKRVTPKSILYHEAMHQYFHYANGEMPPASWFNEGFGEYFGAAKTDRYEKIIRSIGKNDFRFQVIKRAKKDRKWPEIKKILPMPQRIFYDRKSKDYPVLDNYAFGWAFCYFLENERKKPKGERNEEWAAIPDAYLKNLRAATGEYAKKLPSGAPKGTLMRFASPVQKAAYERTFKNTDFAKLQAAWVAAMKSW